jgi:hypothetical protein
MVPPQPPLGLFHSNFPTPGVGFSVNLTTPPFPAYVISYPLPVTFFETLFSEEFWGIHFKNYGMLRLKRPTTSYRLMSDPTASWTVVNDPDNLQILQPNKTAQQFAALFALTPTERATQEQQMKSDAVTVIQEEIIRRRKKVTTLMAEGEACGRLVLGSVQLIHAILRFIPMLETMVAEHRRAITQLLQFEKGGQAPLLVGNLFCPSSIWSRC